MHGLAFSSPGRLALLALVAVLAVAYVLAGRRRRRSVEAVPLPGLDLLAASLPRLGWRRHLPAAALLLALGLGTLAFAAPTAEVRVPRERATVIVALDVSLSMSATDVSPDRLSAAKDAARQFVGQLPARFNVGLVAFAGTASSVVAPTQDHEAVARAIDDLQLANGTAIGDAVDTALTAIAAVPGAKGSAAPPARVVLLSDGGNTQGRSLAQAEGEAQSAKVPVSTIAYGTPDGVVRVPEGLIRVPVDAAALAELASTTSGHAYQARSGSELRSVYADIGSQVGYRLERHSVAAGMTGFALLAALAAGAAALVWSPRRV
ncbi:Ca-activated chloride channel family protein [Motilibacter rhizosphaerae]|uniref:Ca-activated chloride channel family protein n=1 Tax=Motilibacter rhizosphaerae TaxID=598652 RepID=A0A4Q7NRF0_9ACTN|nr:VWA domain-containing protein [Motilibacter rhizosphaerae]RZS89653.1 Ca-activated chloride channel family protein [Motilibacter rhizosphaerae]